VGVGTILDRSGGHIDFSVPQHALATLSMQNYQPEDCPLCRQGSQAEKPGSRQS
jgi:orotate phosphoribosyltransferase